MSVQKRVSQFYDEDRNPCIEESKLSQKCLEKNNFDYNKCTLYFDNYNFCKKFWRGIQTARSRAGIQPTLPGKEEREKIMEEKKKGVRVISAS